MRKRNISLLILAAIVTFLMAGCKKDTTTLKARISPFSNESKVYISGTSTPRWETGDLVNVNGTPCTVSVSTTSTIEAPTSSAYQAVYPNDLVATNGNQLGNYTVTLNIPRVQAYETTTNGQVVKAPMGAFVNGSSLQFTNMGALLAIAVKNDRSDRDNLVIDSIAVQTVGTSPVLLWGTATVNDITSSDRAYEVSSTGLTETEIANHRIISLAKSNKQGNLATLAYNNEPKTFYLYVPSVSGSIDNRYKITIYSHIGGTKYIYERTQSNAGSGNIGLSQYAAVPYMTNDATETAQADKWLPGSIHSIFTIYNSNIPSQKQYIYFSQGNLQYINNQYQFASNQQDYIPTTTTIGANNTDLFAILPLGLTYYDIGPTIAISNGGGQHTENWNWRTLSSDEWGRLLGLAQTNNRTVKGGRGEGYCFNIVNLNGTLGMLIYPDNYEGTTYGTAESTWTDAEDYPGISQIPEGCVFLPAAGQASAAFSRSQTGRLGYYWANNGYQKNGKHYFYRLLFGLTTNSEVNGNEVINPNNGTGQPKFAIRLVRDTTSTQ